MSNWDIAKRQYLELTPATDSISNRMANNLFRTIQSHERTDTSAGLWDYVREFLEDGLDVFRDDPPPVYEWVITATPGETGPTLDYYVGTDPQDEQTWLGQQLETHLPNEYQLSTVETEPLAQITESAEEFTAVEYCGEPASPWDWTMPLSRFDGWAADTENQPLAAVIETLGETDRPCLFQVCIQRMPNFSSDRHDRKKLLQKGKISLENYWTERIIETFASEVSNDPSQEARERIELLDARNVGCAFRMSIRALIAGSGPEATALGEKLAGALEATSGQHYSITGQTTTETDDVRDDIRARRIHSPAYDSWRQRWGLTEYTSRGIVADNREIGNFCLLDGNALTKRGQQALGVLPEEQTTHTGPSMDLLEQYTNGGFPVGRYRSETGDDTRIAVPPALQPQHIGLFGKSGSGKSVALINAILENYAATDGANILVEPKGGEMVINYLRAHYARYGDLDNVYYFDCSETLPAVSLLDIRADLAAGVKRTTAVERTVDHYMEILRQIMAGDTFDDAVRSPDVIRYLLKAQFDPVYGADAFTHADLKAEAAKLQEDQTPPPVSDADLAQDMATITNNSSRTFDNIMGGVATRLDKISLDARLKALFNTVPEAESDRFDLADFLDEDAVIIFDVGELRQHAQRAVTLVVLSNLWSALNRRQQRRDLLGNAHTTDTESSDDHSETPNSEIQSSSQELPLVNVYLEEAGSLATTDLISEMLDQSRSFGVSLTLATQFPGQIRDTDEGAYKRLLNNVSTFVTGNIPVDEHLAERLDTAAVPRRQVKRKLGSLASGQWLATLPSAHGVPEPQPFEVTSLPLPEGHPEHSDTPDIPPRTVRRAIASVKQRSADRFGVSIADSPETAHSESNSTSNESGSAPPAVDSALPFTERMPPTVAYVEDAHALSCTECDTQHNPTVDGLYNGINCCSTVDAVDSANIPICNLHLNMSADERAATEYSRRQLYFLQAVYDAQSLTLDRRAYDIVWDSMQRLREYLGIEKSAVDALIDAGLLKRDKKKPHLLYSITHAGRTLINEGHRRGIDHGHRKGDLEETSEHVLMVEVGRRYLVSEYVEDDASPVTEVIPYYEPSQGSSVAVSAATAMGSDGDPQEAVDESDRRRLDVVGVDASGEVVVALEAERINNDVAEAVVADFDKMAELQPAEAIWVVPSRSDGARILDALNEPSDGSPRVDKEYSTNTAPEQYRIDTPGLTSVRTVETVRDDLRE